MAGINGIVYILIGAFVALISWKIDFDDLQAFFYIGIFFAAVGIFKIIFSLMRKNEEKKVEHHKAHHAASSNQRGAAHRTQHPQLAQAQYKRCPRCHSIMKVHDNFCPRCGARA